MSTLFIVRAHISVLLDPIRGGRAYGDIDAVLAATDAIEAEAKARDLLGAYGMNVLGVNEITEVAASRSFGMDLDALIADVSAEPEQIKLSSLQVHQRK